MSLTRDDEPRVSPLPDMLLQELVSMQERCSQLERQLRNAERSRDESVERLYDMEQARDMAEASVELYTDVLREKSRELKERDDTIQRLNLVLSFALGGGQARKDDAMHELWNLATSDPPCSKRRKLSESLSSGL